jgi:hypothetical protein
LKKVLSKYNTVNKNKLEKELNKYIWLNYYETNKITTTRNY